MKLLCFFLLSCSLLISCSNDEEMLEICNSELLPRFAGDGEYDVLGMGYDVTGEYLHPLSVKSPVLDINKYKQDHEGRLITGTPSFGYDKMVSGYNSTDYVKKITEESKVKINLRFGNAKDTMACFSQSITNTFTSEYSRSTKYSFASLDAIRNTKYIRINDEVSDISKYLSNEFTEDLKNLSADRIVERYGTHVLTDFVIGGRYKLIFRSVIAKQMDSSTKRKAVESSFELSLKKIGFSVNVENSTQIDESLTAFYENSKKDDVGHVTQLPVPSTPSTNNNTSSNTNNNQSSNTNNEQDSNTDQTTNNNNSNENQNSSNNNQNSSTNTNQNNSSTTESNAALGVKIANYALAKQGSRYYWGASGPTYFDCSGLVYWAHKQAGVRIGRTTAAGYAGSGKSVSYNNLQIGDVITFNYGSGVAHIGIYIGNGRMVHASGKGSETVGQDPNQCVKVTSIAPGSYFYNYIYNCRRLY